MAYSGSIRKGQIAITCQLCESGEKINSKCLDCNLLLCDKCKDIHQKIKNAKDHKIVDIKDVGKHTEANLDFSNIKCKQHAGQSCCLFCQTCDNVVCPSCIAKVHKKHDLVEISEAYEKKVETLKTRQNKLTEEQSKIKTNQVRLRKLKSAKSEKYNQVDQAILDHGKALKQAVDLRVEKIRKELKEKQNVVLKSMTSDLETLERTSQQCDDHKSKTEDLIHTNDVSKFFEEVCKIEKLTDQSFLPEIKTTYNSIPIFVPGEITQSNVGVLQTDNKLLDIELRVVKEFQTELPVVYSVCPCPDNSLWISHDPTEAFKKVKPHGNTLQILSSYKVKVWDMALTPNNDLLLTTGESCLQQIKHSTGTIQDSIYNTDPFQIASFHVSKDYKVMVGGIDFDKDRQVVIVMNKEGKQLNVYEQDKQNLPLLTYPMGITSTSNATVYVSDYDPDDDHGRLVILDPTGDVQYYTGHPLVNKYNPFRPEGLTTTPKDHVIVTDRDTYTLHIFNDLGQLMTYFNTRDVGIQYPFSLGFTSSGQLYIGCTVDEDSEDNAKLYQVNISGC